MINTQNYYIACLLLFVTGVYDLSFDLLSEPSDYYQVREVKEWFVQYLVTMLQDKETDHEDLTDPLLVIASCAANEFKAANQHNYTYEVKVKHSVK